MSGRGRRGGGDDRDRGGGRRGERGGRDRDHDRDRGGGGRGGRDRKGGGRRGDVERPGDVQFKIAKNVEREREKQLDMEFPALMVKPKGDVTTPIKNGLESPDVANVLLKQRDDAKRSESPAVSKIGARSDSISEKPKEKPKLRQALKFVDENHVFCDGISEFLTDNTDFLVIGVIGLQNSGKSTILNSLAKLSKNDDDFFRVQNYEHQMLGEHCTNGIDIYVNARRIILLDCQPLLSASVMDRTIQLEKKNTSEFTTIENTMEVQSLQMIGFLFSVCHTVLFVQDWVTDMNLVRLLMAAEMLKPVTPTVSAEDKSQVTEYFPHLVIVHNKAEFTDMEPLALDNIENIYSRVLQKSRLQWRRSDDSNRPLVVAVPDQEDRQEEQRKMKSFHNFEAATKILRRTVFSLKRSPLTQTKLTERTWVSLANRTWDNIKNSSFYMEYSRLLP